MTFRIFAPIETLNNIILSLIFFTSMTLSTHFSATSTPTPANPSLPFQKNLYLLPFAPSHLLPSPLHLVSCKQQKSRHLLLAISATSPSLLDIVPTFHEPTLNRQPVDYQAFCAHHRLGCEMVQDQRHPVSAA